MKQTYYFQYNLPADNHRLESKNHFIDVKSEMIMSIVFAYPLVEKIDLVIVKDWRKVLDDVEKIAEAHFAEIIRQREIEHAKEVLALNDNPVLDRMNNAKEIGTIVINQNGVAEPV